MPSHRVLTQHRCVHTPLQQSQTHTHTQLPRTHTHTHTPATATGTHTCDCHGHTHTHTPVTTASPLQRFGQRLLGVLLPMQVFCFIFNSTPEGEKCIENIKQQMVYPSMPFTLPNVNTDISNSKGASMLCLQVCSK